MRCVRLYINAPFIAQMPLSVSLAQAHYLMHVMRCAQGNPLVIFNGRDGEWDAVLDLHKKTCVVIPQKCRRLQPAKGIQIALIQGLIKRQDMVIEKATELGVAEIFPIKMDRSVVTALNAEKALCWAMEAAEQSERLTVPVLHGVTTLQKALEAWPEIKPILWACARSSSPPLATVLSNIHSDFALLIGPEGGFSDAEQQYLQNHPAVIPVGLGPTILRAETAAIVALALSLEKGFFKKM